MVVFESILICTHSAMERCVELMADDPARQHRRHVLMRERENFTKAQQWLRSARKEDDVDEAVKTQPDVNLPAGEWA